MVLSIYDVLGKDWRNEQLYDDDKIFELSKLF